MGSSSSKSKRSFDKKAWRKKKYDKKVLVDEWKNKRKSFMTHKYNKVLKKEAAGLDVAKIYTEEVVGEAMSTEKQMKPKKKSSFQRAQQSFAEKKAEKEAKQKAYKDKKNKRNSTINAKTKKGQPLMGGRIQLLLERIQGST